VVVLGASSQEGGQLLMNDNWVSRVPDLPVCILEFDQRGVKGCTLHLDIPWD
jgi:hypothetical protein